MKKNISDIRLAKLCCSCGACSYICRKNLITFKESIGGYLEPYINSSKCTDCGLCYHVCPSIHLGPNLKNQLPNDPFIGNIKTAYIGKSIDSEIYKNSQSGGVVTALLNHLFKTQQIEAAIVTVMKHSNPPRGDVILARNKYDLLIAQKSKYTPVPVLKILKEINDIRGKIAIVGLPCHIQGLYNILDLKPDLKDKIVLKVGLICERVLTTAAIDFLTYKAKIKNPNHIVFKDKNRPHYPGNIIVSSNKGEEVELDPQNRMLIKDYFTPVRCAICWDKMNVFSDITFGDPHGIPDIDRLLGEGLILPRTDVGAFF